MLTTETYTPALNSLTITLPGLDGSLDARTLQRYLKVGTHTSKAAKISN